MRIDPPLDAELIAAIATADSGFARLRSRTQRVVFFPFAIRTYSALCLLVAHFLLVSCLALLCIVHRTHPPLLFRRRLAALHFEEFGADEVRFFPRSLANCPGRRGMTGTLAAAQTSSA